MQRSEEKRSEGQWWSLFVKLCMDRTFVRSISSICCLLGIKDLSCIIYIVARLPLENRNLTDSDPDRHPVMGIAY
jgi:hypothetical protein